MLELVITTLPLSIAAAVSVSSILVFFSIMVAREKQVQNGLAFISGGVASYTVIYLLVFFSFAKAAPHGAPKHLEIHAIADFVLAALCVLLVVKSLLKKDAPAEKHKEIPGGVFAYFGIGAAMRAASANTLPPFIAAAKDVSGAHAGLSSSVILGALIIFITMSPMIIPWLLFVFSREKAIALITPVSVFLEKNKAKISNSVLIIIAVYIAMHGFKRLGMM